MLTLSKCRQNLSFLKSHQAILLKFRKLSFNLIVQQNLSFSLADHLSKIYPIMFPDSKIEKVFDVRERKLTQILNGAAASIEVDTSLKKTNVACTLIFDINPLMPEDPTWGHIY